MNATGSMKHWRRKLPSTFAIIETVDKSATVHILCLLPNLLAGQLQVLAMSVSTGIFCVYVCVCATRNHFFPPTKMNSPDFWYFLSWQEDMFKFRPCFYFVCHDSRWHTVLPMSLASLLESLSTFWHRQNRPKNSNLAVYGLFIFFLYVVVHTLIIVVQQWVFQCVSIYVRERYNLVLHRSFTSKTSTSLYWVSSCFFTRK
jgi:hypothetical protein